MGLTLLRFNEDSQSSPSSQTDRLDRDIPLDSCLADRPHRHGRYCSSDGQSPEGVTDCRIWIEATEGDTQAKQSKNIQHGIREIKIFSLLT